MRTGSAPRQRNAAGPEWNLSVTALLVSTAMHDGDSLAGKKRTLEQGIRVRGSLLVAFSGGVDSTLLAVRAQEILGKGTRCVLLDSPVVPRAAVKEAQTIADAYGLTLEIIPVPLMEYKEFTQNPHDRCYHCKKISACHLRQRASGLGLACIADGMNVSDTGEHRPGLAASTEEGIIHPFIEAGITKEDIRLIAREHGLFVWDKPSAACLASRIPYGEEITEKKLIMIEKAEEYLRQLGIRQLRVRLHAGIARIETDDQGMAAICSRKKDVAAVLKRIGFSYITLDLEGYRSGSMDEVL